MSIIDIIFNRKLNLTKSFRTSKIRQRKNQCVSEKLGVQNIVKEIKQYQQKWLQHVQRMDTNRIPKQAVQ
jgi:hypothetical protein